MERPNFVKNGGALRLPPGFRFHPTDEELVVQYLQRKVQSQPLPASIIPEIDVCNSDPWELPGESDAERYFFSARRAKYPNGSRSNRATGSGYWKATGLDKKIVSSKGHGIVGLKKTLVFYRGKAPKGSRTDWIMHEYRLHGTLLQESEKEDWVLCRVFLKKRSSNKNGEAEHSRGLVFYDFMGKERVGSGRVLDDSNSGSSGVTDVSNKDDHEESSSCNNSSFRYMNKDN